MQKLRTIRLRSNPQPTKKKVKRVRRIKRKRVVRRQRAKRAPGARYLIQGLAYGKGRMAKFLYWTGTAWSAQRARGRRYSGTEDARQAMTNLRLPAKLYAAQVVPA